MPTAAVSTPRVMLSSPKKVPTIMEAVPMSLNPINRYDRGRVTCTCDEKRTASMMSGHTWNIINQNEEHEVYLRNARNPDHYIDAHGKNTHHWFEKKRRADLDGDGVPDCVDSSNVEEVMNCPPTAGKEAAHLQHRMCKQLCQAAAPRDFRRHQNLRSSTIAPPTPERPSHERKVPFQEHLRDPHKRPTPSVVEKQHWTPRRGEARQQLMRADEHTLFRNIDQIRGESHSDLQDPMFAEALHSARSAPLAAGGACAVLEASTFRSAMGLGRHCGRPAKPTHERLHHSSTRLEPYTVNNVTSWPTQHQDKIMREDPYFVKPVAQASNSSVKYDILTGERRHYFY